MGFLVEDDDCGSHIHMLRLRTFGGLSLLSGSEAITSTVGKRPLALLALLAMAGARGVRREKAVALLTDESRGHLALAHKALGALSQWDHDPIDAAVREVAESAGLKLGKLAQPLRAALTGKTTSPGIFDFLILLGIDESLARIADQMLEQNA